MTKVRYRFQRVGEETALSALVMRMFDEFVAPDLTDEGKKSFRDYAAPARLREPDRRRATLVAVSGEQLVGVGRIGRRRETDHIDLLFVDKTMHGQGIGRELIERLLDIARRNNPTAERVTVNATRFAVPFYLRVGFQPMGGEQTLSGIISMPMEAKLTAPSEERPS